jgi:hypothetical protein
VGEGKTPASEKQAHTREPDGKFKGPQPTSFKPGQSGNPGGYPKGFQKPALRLRNKYGSQEGWEKLEKLLDTVADPDEALALLRVVVQNDHALDRSGDADEGQEKRGKVVRLEGEGDDG